MIITPALCQLCGACCSQVVAGELVACRHLDVSVAGFQCRIYATRPLVCREYSCLRDGEPTAAVAPRVAQALAKVTRPATGLRC